MIKSFALLPCLALPFLTQACMTVRSEPVAAVRGEAIQAVYAVAAPTGMAPDQPVVTGRRDLHPTGHAIEITTTPTDILLPCGDEETNATLSRGGAFQLAIRDLSAPSGADFSLRIFDITDEQSPALLQELDLRDLAPSSDGEALSRLIWTTFDEQDRPQCPALRIQINQINAGGAAAKARIFSYIYAYEQQDGPTFSPQGEIGRGNDAPLLAALTSATQPTRQVVTEFSQSVALIKSQVGLRESCTGVLIGNRRLLTNQHCVARWGLRAGDVCSGLSVFFDQARTETRKQWVCEKVLFVDVSLDAALLEVKPPVEGLPTRRFAPLPIVRRALEPLAPVPGGANDYSVLLLHHKGGGNTHLSFNCGPPERPPGDAAMKFALDLQNTHRNGATLLHGCNSDKGSSGSPLVRLSTQGAEIVGLHYSDWVSDENEQHFSCFKLFLQSKASGDLRPRNLAFDAFDLRCALEKAGEMPASGACTAWTPPAPAPMISEQARAAMKQEWARFGRDNGCFE